MEARARFKHLAIYWTGWAFIVLGILGIFLPILQGILFLLVGLMLLSNSSPRAARLLNKLRERFPRLGKTLDQATAKAKQIQSRISAHFDTAKAHARRIHGNIFRKRAKNTENL
jgi:uncharacterized membrane protein YbaN (DUF454 family)